MKNVLEGLSLYIHIPFCLSRCRYCDFNTYSGLSHLIPRYVEALERELAMQGKGRRASTIYFGGGTPSLLTPQQLDSVLEACRQHFQIEERAEISLEANPGTIDLPWLRHLRSLGFNRLSLGFQSLDDAELSLLGRRHSAAEALSAYTLAREAGFSNINLDFIYGLPSQTLSRWQQTLGQAVELSPEHLSLYALAIEEDTPLGQAIARGELPAPDPDTAADMYAWAEETLEAANYEHYEISNWARPGYYCRHNLTYWKNMPYLGVGAGAHSFIDGCRLANLSHPLEYIDSLEAGRLPVASREAIVPTLEMAETLILGLRLVEGVDLEEVSRRCRQDIAVLYQKEIEELLSLGLVGKHGLRLRLTRRGRLLGNEVFWRFLPQERSGV